MPSENQDLRMLGRVVIEILEEAAFLFCEPMDEMNRTELSPEVLMAKLGFKGPSSGEMIFSAPPETALEIAANLLGLDPNDPEVSGKGAEAVGEILNIIGGALLKEWFGSSADFEMGIPEVMRVTGAELEHDTARAELHLPLMTDEGFRIDAAVIK